MHFVNANGAEIPALGLGTWTLKGDPCAELVNAAIGGGYRHIDTAAMYGNEKDVGHGIAQSGVDRSDLFVTTKVWWTDIGSGDLQRSAEQSLRRLGLGHVDLLLIHWPNPAIPLEASISALNEVADEGLTRHIGVSNFTAAMIEGATRLSARPLVCNQVEYHPYLSQNSVRAALDAHGMALTAYCPLSRGGDLFGEPAVAEAAARHGKTPGQIVLRWHVQQPSTICIPRTSRTARLAENIDIFDFELDDAEMAAISALSARQLRICDFEFSPAWDEN